MLAARRCNFLSPRLPARQVHATAVVGYPRGKARETRDVKVNEDSKYDVDFMPEFEDDDATSAAHMIIQQQRQILSYLRLIEREVPQLQALRQPFVPPSDSNALVVRSISYGGEKHPATRKRVIIVAVSKLPLNSPEAIHKFKLLAGPRWSAKPPRDSGIGSEEDASTGKHGYIKISCEDFPEPSMNLKWGSDVLDNLLQEATDAKDTFADIPHDQRHLAARARKHRQGDHVRGRLGPRPTIKDFPKHWLPPLSDQPSSSTTTTTTTQ